MSQRTIVPNIPPDVRNRYLERRAKDLDELRVALANGTFDVFKHVGHQIKGNAASFGYLDLESLAVRLENAGETKDFSGASVIIDQFDAWLKAQAGK